MYKTKLTIFFPSLILYVSLTSLFTTYLFLSFSSEPNSLDERASICLHFFLFFLLLLLPPFLNLPFPPKPKYGFCPPLSTETSNSSQWPFKEKKTLLR